MFDLNHVPFWWLAAIFLGCAAVITYSGIKLAHTAEDIAAKTGWGQAIVGAVFLGISTSLSGTILSFYAAGQGHPSLAISNAVGGIAAQTVFLALADLTYRKANLEHAASSLENLLQTALLMTLLAVPLLAMAGPDVTFLNIHPASPALVILYLFGLHAVKKTKDEPLWFAVQTKETKQEKKAHETGPESISTLALYFVFLAMFLCASGIVLADTAIEISARTGINETIIGGYFTSVTTSLPELITVLAAVQRGALTLAVADIIGGNSFDVLFLAGADLFYTEGSLYHQFTDGHVAFTSMAMLMAGMLMLGLLRREKTGPVNIGFESVAVLALYGVLIAITISGA